MTRLTHILLATAFLTSCAGASSPTGSSVDGDAKQRFDAAASQRDRLAREFSGVSPDLREKCEILAGDCLIGLRERRSELMESYPNRVLACPPADDPEVRFRCVAVTPDEPDPTRKAQPTDQTRPFSDYYRDEGACFGELIKCTVALTEKAKAAAREAKRQERQREVESSAAAVAARNAVALIEEKIKYVRLTFPVQSEEICPPADSVPDCLEQATNKLAGFEAELKKDDSYDGKTALAAYQASKQAEAACHDPEFRCLTAKLTDFGATPETRRLVEQNLDLLAERTSLSSQVNDAVAQQCLTDGINRHQADILQKYQDYVRQSKLYYRYQLDQAFLAMHASQVKCLKSRTKRSSG